MSELVLGPAVLAANPAAGVLFGVLVLADKGYDSERLREHRVGEAFGC